MKLTLLLAGSSLARGSKQKDRKLRGTQKERNLPKLQQLDPLSSWGSGFEPIDTPAPTPWEGDSWGGLSTGGWGPDGWEGSWGGSWEGNLVKGSGGRSSKSNKMSFKVDGGSSKSNKNNYMVSEGSISSGSKSEKGYGSYMSGGKSDKGSSSKGYGLNSYEVGSSSKSNKGYGLNVSGGSSKSNKAYGLNVYGGSKSEKGPSGVYISVVGGNSSKSNKGTPVNPIKPIKPIEAWKNDGYAPVPVPIVRGKVWGDDGHASLLTPKPTPWRGDAYLPTDKPVPSFVTPAPTICEERMVWHPNADYTMCTNDDNYFPNSSYIYNSLSRCCKALFGTLTCDYVDICNPEPVETPEPTYSPVTPVPTPCEAQVFFFDGYSCSNEFYIADAPAYSTIMACCNLNFGIGSYPIGGCQYDDICNPNKPSNRPSARPSNRPTRRPSNAPTPKPTNAPIELVQTPEPSLSPITPAPTPCEAQVFYFNSEVCSNEFYMPNAPAYNSLMLCCNLNFGIGSYLNGACQYVDECNTLPPSPKPSSKPTPVPSNAPTTPSPTTCEERLWHPNPYFKFCINDSNFPTSWTSLDAVDSYFYDSLEQCCIAVFGTISCDHVDICVTYSPSASPVTDEPTPNPTPLPSPLPSRKPSTRPTPFPTPLPTPLPSPLPTPKPSPLPTNKPTPQPIDLIVTPSPTTCEEREWCVAYSGDQMICSNVNDCSNGWEGDGYVFNSSKDCCISLFGSLTNCEYYDICAPITPNPTPKPSPLPTKKPTPLPSPLPTPRPTNKPTTKPIEPIETPEPSLSPVTPSPTPCEAQLFYFNGNVCTNDNQFFIAGTPSYNSLMICCNTVFGAGSFMNGSCNYIDICNTLPPSPEPTESPITPSPTPCEALEFFFDGAICSNDIFIADAPAFISLKKCCNFNFGFGSLMNGSCSYIDICNTLPPSPAPMEFIKTLPPTEAPITPEPTPVPSPFPTEEPVTPEPTESPITPAPTPCEALAFFFDGDTCSNDIFIADAPAFNSLQNCCNVNFGPGAFANGSCSYVDICNTLPPSPAPTFISTTIPPTPSPSFGATPTVSKETTGPPTMYAGRGS